MVSDIKNNIVFIILVPKITKEFNDIDEALRLGFNWAMGPFEMLGQLDS